MSAELRIGTSGYIYEHWRGIFYPKELRLAEWFAYYTRYFDTVEINNTFYRLPSADVFRAWRRQAPPGFLYALKYSRYGTHMKKLKDPEPALDLYLPRAERLGKFLGPLLVQLPPRWKANPERLGAFLEVAPGKHRWAVEFRDPSWLREDIYRLLEKHNAALCIHDMIANHPWRTTADWVYLRFHGAPGGGNYSDAALHAAAGRIGRFLDDGLDVYAYFNNDARGYAIKNALELRQQLQPAAAETSWR